MSVTVTVSRYLPNKRNWTLGPYKLCLAHVDLQGTYDDENIQLIPEFKRVFGLQEIFFCIPSQTRNTGSVLHPYVYVEWEQDEQKMEAHNAEVLPGANLIPEDDSVSFSGVDFDVIVIGR